MTEQQRTRTKMSQQELHGPALDPCDDGKGGDLREQAAAYAHIAREARDDCLNGVDAEQELLRRRNRSGQ